ncbi:glycosyltransferase family 4 protein [Candidatus Saccharibacteria bacterium]|nr:glycosyltransferase family 4 protein [Candidatus Saccharibacteria bacterium]
MLGWELPPHNSGGLGVACFHMAKALSHKGVDIDFVLPSGQDYSEIDFMKVHAVPSLKKTKTIKTLNKRCMTDSPELDPYTGDYHKIRSVQENYIDYIERLVTTNHYEAIHAHDWLTMEAGIRAKEVSGIPLVVQVHATEFDRAGGGDGNPLIHDIEYQGLMMADRIIAVSKLTKDLIVKKYSIPSDKIEVVHNALAREELEKVEVEGDNYRYLDFMRERGYMIVTIGGTRHTIQKGLTFLLEGFKKALDIYPKMILVMSGDGEQRDELLERTASLGITENVVFTGFVRGAKWRELYMQGDVFVMSSVSEPFGLTALEAAAHNTALVLTKQSGVAEQINSVLKYDFWDTDRLADDLVNLALSPALQDSLKENVAGEYIKYNWGHAADKFMRQYTSASHGARQRGAAYA